MEFWLPLACPKEFLDILGVPAASLQRGSNRAAVTGSSSSRKKRLRVSVTSSTKCSPGRSFTDRASLRKSARSRRLRARAPPFRYTPSRRRPENSQCLYSLLPKHPPSTQHPTCDPSTPRRHSAWLLGAQRGGNLLPWSASHVSAQSSSSESLALTTLSHTGAPTILYLLITFILNSTL